MTYGKKVDQCWPGDGYDDNNVGWTVVFPAAVSWSFLSCQCIECSIAEEGGERKVVPSKAPRTGGRRHKGRSGDSRGRV